MCSFKFLVILPCGIEIYIESIAVNLVGIKDAVAGILRAADNAERAEVWNIGGVSDYDVNEVKQVRCRFPTTCPQHWK